MSFGFDNSPYLYRNTRYGRGYRPVQTVKQTLKGAESVLIVTNQYSFTGKVLGYHEAMNPYQENLRVITKNTLDIEGKTTQIHKGVNNSTADKLIVTNEFDRLGRMRLKTTGTGTICESLENYTYNIRGWLRGMNMAYLQTDIKESSQRYFGYELAYNTMASSASLPTPQFNGNIGSMIWASAGKAGRDDQGVWIPASEGIMRKYDYTYDNSNRLKKADFTEYKANTWGNSEKDFSVGGNDNGMIDYDVNGNILSMNQLGLKDIKNIEPIDLLTYTYFNNGFSNRLKAVHDDANDAYSDQGDFKEGSVKGSLTATTDQDYVYDDNGNMIKDRNRDINTYGFNPNAPAIVYNYLNLPSEVKVLIADNTADKGSVKFVYDAFGNKLQKITTDLTTNPVSVTTTDYIGSFTYDNLIGTGLSHIATEEGRIRYAIQPNNTADYKYNWFVKDHLGNTRMVLTEEPVPSPLKPYKATFEDAPTQKVGKEQIAMERELFGEDVLSPVRSPLPIELRDKDPGNKKCALLRPGSTNGKVPFKILKVKAGDKFTAAVQYYYRPHHSKSDGKKLREHILNNIVGGLFGLGNGPGGGSKDVIDGQILNNSPAANPGALREFTNEDTEKDKGSMRPKAYLNYVLMDTGMQFIKGGALRVGSMDAKELEWKNLVQEDIKATQAGYVLVYISNEEEAGSNINDGNVYFDNLVIITNEGPIMEENHYYPFGLLIHPLSTSGSGRLRNKMKYNGKEMQNEEFADGSGLEWHDYGARMYDQQIGRWNCPDPLSKEMEFYSPYVFSFNNSLRFLDKDGMAPEDWIRSYRTGKYIWKDNVTSVNNTPVNYQYIGPNDNDILRYLGWGKTYPVKWTEVVGTMAMDHESEGPLRYSTNATVRVRVDTRLTLKAETRTIFKSDGEFSKEFLGVSVNATNVSRYTGSTNITAIGNMSFNFHGVKYSVGLGESNDKHTIKESGTSITMGSAFIPAEHIARGDNFPSVKVSGNWWNLSERTPVVFPGTFFSRTYEHIFNPQLSGIWRK